MRDMARRSKLSVQFGRILDACEIKGKSFHCLRTTLATELNIKGESLENIAEALGHASTRTTEGYIRKKLG
jgi:integrase